MLISNDSDVSDIIILLGLHGLSFTNIKLQFSAMVAASKVTFHSTKAYEVCQHKAVIKQ